MKRYVIYIPGLGDGYDTMRRLALSGWRIFGIQTELVPMKWYDGDDYEAKYQRAAVAIARATMSGYSVSLVGESAGGSMALNLAAHHPNVVSTLTIAGVNHPAAHVSPLTLRRSPAFTESIKQLSDSLKKLNHQHVMTMRGAKDSVVHERYSKVKGAREQVVPMVGHLATIVFCLTLWSYVVVRAIKSQA